MVIILLMANVAVFLAMAASTGTLDWSGQGPHRSRHARRSWRFCIPIRRLLSSRPKD
jgi:hypothetical protein